MDIRKLRKKVLIESAIGVAVMAVLGGGAYYIDSLTEGYTTEYNGLAGEVSTMSAQVNTLKSKYTKIQENQKVYRGMLKRTADGSLTLDRDIVRKKFDRFKTRYFLDSMRLSMTQPQEMVGAQYKRKSGSIIASDITVNFECITDEDAYELIQAIHNEFEGTVKITQFALTRLNTITSESLRSISRSGRYPMIKGMLKFTWFGIKTPEVAPPAAPGAPGAVPGGPTALPNGGGPRPPVAGP